MDASSDGRIDRDMNESEAVRPGNQAMRFDARNSQAPGDFALGEARAVIEPCRPSAELLVPFVERWRYAVSHFAPLIFFSWHEIFFMMQSTSQDAKWREPR